MQNLDLSKDICTFNFGLTNAEKRNQITTIAYKHVQHIEIVTKLHDDMHNEILHKASKIQGITHTMKHHKKAFDDYFVKLSSEYQKVMDLAEQKIVVTRADILVTKSKNGLGNIDVAIVLVKEKPAPITNSCVDIVEMSKKHNTTQL